MSLPVWEEWIEIASIDRKWKKYCVSSRMGRVDWNFCPSRREIANRGLFPYGKSGLKYTQTLKTLCDISLFPYGKSGLKSPDCFPLVNFCRSLPVWEEWIEITRICCKNWQYFVSSRMGRVDWNKCGYTADLGTHGSLPVWEEWIEIGGGTDASADRRSLPVWEEWIEIYTLRNYK